MAVATSTMLGRLVWYELMTSDMKSAENFYKAVVGWKTAPFDGAGQPSTIFNRAGDVGVGGVMTKPAEMKAPPFWAMYIGVPKLEEGAATIKKLGGKAHTEVIQIPDVGRVQSSWIRRAPLSGCTRRRRSRQLTKRVAPQFVEAGL